MQVEISGMSTPMYGTLALVISEAVRSTEYFEQ